MDQMADLIKCLKLCVRLFKRVEEGYIQEKEKLQTELESAEKKCIDTGAKATEKLASMHVVDLTLLPEEQVLNGNQPDVDDCVACENQDEEAFAMVEENPSGDEAVNNNDSNWMC